jgi:hypothetical protein
VPKLTTAFCRLLFVVVLVLAESGCSRRRAAAIAQSTPVQITLRVRNNLNAALNLSARQGTNVFWTGNVAANSVSDIVIGQMILGSHIALRAATPQGATVASRENVVVRETVLIWTIP